MKFLLDTNICIYVINHRPPQVLARFRRFEPHELGVSTVTASELFYGAAKSNRPRENKEALRRFLTPLAIAPYDEAAARIYGDIRSDLEKRGQVIGPLDMMIAAHASSLGIPLVTNNVKEFRRVNELVIEDWVEPEAE